MGRILWCMCLLLLWIPLAAATFSVACCDFSQVVSALTTQSDVALASGTYTGTGTAGCGLGASYRLAAPLILTGATSGGATVIDCATKGTALIVSSDTNGHAISNIEFRRAATSAVRVVASGNTTLTNCIFASNTFTASATQGAGLTIDTTNVAVVNCNFTSNSAIMGAAIFANASANRVFYMSSSLFVNNRMTGVSGASYTGSVHLEDSVLSFVYNSIFTGNSALYGGAGIISESLMEVINCTFKNNVGTGSVCLGAVGFLSTWGKVDHCSFIGNTNKYASNENNNRAIVKMLSGAFTNNLMDSTYNTNWCFYSIGAVVSLFQNNTFTNNSVDYGMFVYNAALVVDRLYARGNAPNFQLIEQQFGSRLVVSNSVFVSNCANTQRGVLIHTMQSFTFMSVQNCTFITNKSTLGLIGGTANAYEVRNSSFTGNSGGDGGITNMLEGQTFTLLGSYVDSNYAATGSVASLTRGTFISINNTYTNNNATNGGVLYSIEGQATFQYSVFRGNSVVGSGGAIFGSGAATTTVANSLFTSNSASQAGACIFGFLGPTVNIMNVRFIGNSGSSGGAIFADSARLTVDSCVATGNQAIQGGAVYLGNGVTATLSGSTFATNQALSGGAVFFNDGSLAMTRLTFTGNTALLEGGAASFSSNVTISASSFNQNIALQSGGAISLQLSATASIIDTTFFDNAGLNGGALSGQGDSVASVTRCVFVNSTARQDGGAWRWAATGALTAAKCNISRGQAAGNGGGIAQSAGTVIATVVNVTQNVAGGSGGGVYSSTGTLQLTSVFINANSATSGDGGGVLSAGTVTFADTRVFSNTAAGGGGGVACEACQLSIDALSELTLNRAASGGALWCDPRQPSSVAATINIATLITGNVGTSEPLVQANCTACGCCGFDAPTFLVAQASPCVPAVGRACTYGCAAGYQVVLPSAQVTCQAGGVPSTTTCPAIACPPLGTFANGDISYSNSDPHTGDLATFSCGLGYTKIGVDNVVCQGPTWIGFSTLPICQANLCGNLTAPENGYVDRTYGVTGDVATYTCKQGYTLPNGVPIIETTCLLAWTIETPACERGQCPNLPAIANGKIAVSGRATDDVAIFSCLEGYELVGPVLIRCLAPYWNDSSPSCIPIPCPDLEDLPNGVITPKNGSTGDSVSIACDVGYQLDGETNPTCLGPDWLYDDGVSNCSIASCPVPGTPYNTSACQQPLLAGSTCTIACEDGYHGSEFTVTCEQRQINARGRLIQVNSTLTQFPVCTICEAGRYSKSGDTRCSACVNGYTKQEGSANVTQCKCNYGYWQVPGTGICNACPTGGLCMGDEVQPVANVGFFFSGGEYVACSPASACTSNNTCLEGYTGYTCGLCVEGYYRLAGECTKCQSSTDWRLTAAIVGMGLALLLLIPVAKPSSSSELSLNFASVNIFVNFVQITSTFTYFRLPWGSEITAVFNVMSVFNLNIELASPECVVRINFYDKMNTILLIPVAVAFIYLIALAIYLGVLYAWKYRHRPLQHFKARSRAAALDWVGGFLLFLTLLYLYLARTSLGLFSCKTQLDGARVLTLSLADECFTNAWWKQVPVAIIGLIVYVFGIPAGMLYLGWVMRARYGPGSAASNQPSSFFVKKYEQGSWFWEMVIMLRKLFIVCVVLFLVENTIAAVILACGMLFVMCVLTALLQPYLWDGHDLLDFLALLGSLAILFSGLVVNAPSFSARVVADIVAVVLVVLTLVVCFACFVFELQMNIRLRLLTRRITTAIVNRRVHMHRQLSAIEPAYFVGAHKMVVLTASHDGSLRQWAGDELDEELATYEGNDAILHAVVVRRSVVVNEGAKSLKLLDVKSLQVAGSIPVGAVTTSLHAHEGQLVTATDTGSLTVWTSRRDAGSSFEAPSVSGSESENTAGWVQLRRMSTPNQRVLIAVRITPLYVFGCTEDGVVAQWLVETGALLQEWRIKAELTTLELFGSLMCVGAADGLIRIIDTKTNEVHELSGHTGAVTCMAISAGRLVTSSADRTLRIWNLERFTSVLALLSPTLGFSHVAFAGDMLVAGTDDGMLVAYDTSELAKLKRPDGTGPCVRRLCRRGDEDRTTKVDHAEQDEGGDRWMAAELETRVRTVHAHRREEKLVLATLLDGLAQADGGARKAPRQASGSGVTASGAGGDSLSSDDGMARLLPIGPSSSKASRSRSGSRSGSASSRGSPRLGSASASDLLVGPSAASASGSGTQSAE